MTLPAAETRGSKLNPISLILFRIIVMGLAGIPFAYLFDRTNYDYEFMFNLSNEKFILMAFAYTLYAALMMAVLYFALGLRRRIISYIHKDMFSLTPNQYRWIWLITFGLITLSFGYLMIQAGGLHPAVAAIKSDMQEIKILRSSLSESVNMNVYNLSFKFLLPINLIVSLFFLRHRPVYLILSLALFASMSTFVLEKSPVISIVFLVVIFRMLMSGISFHRLVLYVLIAVLLLSVMYFLTRFATDMPSLSSGIFTRVLYGQISDLPRYFDTFEDQKISPATLLPPYLGRLWSSDTIKPASRLVIESTYPEAAALGAVGVANTFFIGEAFAVAGHPGALLSPFLVMANLFLFVYLFSSLKKNFFFVFLFSWFLFKAFEGVFGGISYFTLSGIHLILLVLLYYLMSAAFVRWAKKRKNSATARG